jgi:transcriptional regulator with XRE-family HTH domain
MAINDRIAQLIVELDLSLSSFADSLNVSVPVVHNIIKGRRNKPSYEMLQRIITAYGAISTDWLLKGQGEIWRPQEIEDAASTTNETAEVANEEVDLERRMRLLIDELAVMYPGEPMIAELKELIPELIDQSNYHKDKVVKLYEKNEKIMDLLRDRMGLDI